MARKAIYEYDGKQLLASQLPQYFPNFNYHNHLAIITPGTDLEVLASDHGWLKTEKLVAKPDQLFGKRGKANLLLLNANFEQLKAFAAEKLNKEFDIHGKTGKITRLLVEPHVDHDTEYYVSITADEENDTIHFSKQGGIFVEENWDKVTHVKIPFEQNIDDIDLAGQIPDVESDKNILIQFIEGIYRVFVDQDFTFLEINPFAITDDDKIVPLDLKSRLDDTAYFKHPDTWGNPEDPIEFPGGFGMELLPEEEKIARLDEKTGASLKLNVLNPDGRIWTLLSGGGASVIFTDTIADLGFGHELANYGEYSGNPSREFTKIYAKTVIDLLTRNPASEGRNKYLFIAGGIANFTNVKATFAGVVDAFKKTAQELISANVKIYVRRGGPFEKEGLKLIEEEAKKLGLTIDVHDRYTPLTGIIPLALEAEQ
jgi:ATP-citrate lyase beta-subunit